ncbi:hypothetical protein CANARDRAFT_20521 [[Candida] arabinofermentans NRRL YB-2248]|uniref:Uncharacterized protein n=1 Tax=[Candida] arabinofermentans NRRL YB-2248 TaxID=983967 RepID=A0A1E4T809_9ASCO|nr:hypothetical protein CANARDRAFT_20521 [[Candida] arabinofermentans NRRL YB-2248]
MTLSISAPTLISTSNQSFKDYLFSTEGGDHRWSTPSSSNRSFESCLTGSYNSCELELEQDSISPVVTYSNLQKTHYKTKEWQDIVNQNDKCFWDCFNALVADDEEFQDFETVIAKDTYKGKGKGKGKGRIKFRDFIAKVCWKEKTNEPQLFKIKYSINEALQKLRVSEVSFQRLVISTI